MSWIQVSAEQPSIAPTTLFEIGGLPVSNSMMMSWLILILILLFCFVLKKKISLIPGKIQNIFEMLYEMMQGLIDQITGSRKYTDRLFPLIGTLFLYIGIANLLGIFIPFLSSFLYNGESIFRSPTTDFNVTLALALSMVLLIQFQSIRKFGIIKHLSNYFKFHEIFNGFKKSFGDGILGIVNFIIGLLDIVSEVARVISLSMRLFGNMFAGEMLAVILLSFLAYVLPAAWMAMNLLTGVIHAMVFGALTTAYYMLAIAGEETE